MHTDDSLQFLKAIIFKYFLILSHFDISKKLNKLDIIRGFELADLKFIFF